jgi:hypothetical protein
MDFLLVKMSDRGDGLDTGSVASQYCSNYSEDIRQVLVIVIMVVMVVEMRVVEDLVLTGGNAATGDGCWWWRR